MDMIKLITELREQKNFLGYEFLTWLFLLLDADDGGERVLSILKGTLPKTDVNVSLGTSVITSLIEHREQRTTIKSPVVEANHEVFASLKNGHLMESIALSVSMSEITVTFMLDARDFSFAQVKITSNFVDEAWSVDHDLNQEDRLREEIFLRMATIEDVELVIDTLFRAFFDVRMNQARYHESIEQMRDQVKKRINSYLLHTDQHQASSHSSFMLDQ